MYKKIFFIFSIVLFLIVLQNVNSEIIEYNENEIDYKQISYLDLTIKTEKFSECFWNPSSNLRQCYTNFYLINNYSDFNLTNDNVYWLIKFQDVSLYNFTEIEIEIETENQGDMNFYYKNDVEQKNYFDSETLLIKNNSITLFRVYFEIPLYTTEYWNISFNHPYNNYSIEIEPTIIQGCSILNIPNEIYYLNQSIDQINLTNPCIKIYDNNITLDCQGHTIRGLYKDEGIKSTYDYTKILNCNVSNFTVALFFDNSHYSIVNNSQFTNNKDYGLRMKNLNYVNISNSLFCNNDIYDIYQEGSAINVLGFNNSCSIADNYNDDGFIKCEFNCNYPFGEDFIYTNITTNLSECLNNLSECQNNLSDCENNLSDCENNVIYLNQTLNETLINLTNCTNILNETEFNLSECQNNLTNCINSSNQTITDCLNNLSDCQNNLSYCNITLNQTLINLTECYNNLNQSQINLTNCIINLNQTQINLTICQNNLTSCIGNISILNQSYIICQENLTTCQSQTLIRIDKNIDDVFLYLLVLIFILLIFFFFARIASKKDNF